MSPGVTPAASERVSERRPAVALASHYREAEGLSIAQIAGRLGRSPATVKAYFYDPTGEKARAVKARYQGCAGAAARTRSLGTARATRTRTARPATLARSSLAGHATASSPPCARGMSATGRSLRPTTGRARTHARRRGGRAPERLAKGEWAAARGVSDLFVTWAAAREAAVSRGTSPCSGSHRDSRP